MQLCPDKRLLGLYKSPRHRQGKPRRQINQKAEEFKIIIVHDNDLGLNSLITLVQTFSNQRAHIQTSIQKKQTKLDYPIQRLRSD